MIQRSVEHYRVPVLDGLVERGADAYELTFLGPLRNGASTGGEKRPYFRDQPCVRKHRFGVFLSNYPGVLELVAAERPQVVVMSGSPRNLTSWRMPALCRRIGAIPMMWSKVHSFSGVPPVVLTPIKRRLHLKHDVAICYGKLSRDELVAEGFPADRVFVAQNTIDTRRIFSDAEAITERGRRIREEAGLAGRFVILCVGRMEPDKRHADLLDAWPRLRELAGNMALVFVGGGPMVEAVRERAQAVDRENIVVTGRVPEGDDYAWIATADLSIMPGAVGLAINQSLAFGTPTIIADEVGADTEILEHGVTGWRYPRGDLDALLDVTRSVIDGTADVKGVTGEARRLMHDEVTIENMVESIDAAIRCALDLLPARKEDS